MHNSMRRTAAILVSGDRWAILKYNR